MEEFLAVLLERRGQAFFERQSLFTQRDAVLRAAQSCGRSKLTDTEEREHERLSARIREADAALSGLDSRIDEVEADIKASGTLNPAVARLRAAAGGGAGLSADEYGGRWGRETATRLRQAAGVEQRATISGSVSVPSLLPIGVVPIPRPLRILDLLINRTPTDSDAYVYYKAIARTNRAAPTPDLTQKPTSTNTAEALTDRVRVHAHLAEPLALRIWEDSAAIANWLTSEMYEGVLDSIEHDVVNGDGTGEHQTGILHATGTTTVPWSVDLPTTLRSAVTAMQVIGERPTGWVLSPQDAQTVDLLRWSTQGGLLTDGYQASGGSSNIFGPANLPRVISPSVPAGVAILADWSQLLLTVRQEGVRIDIDRSGPLFQTNAIQLRGEARAGINVLRSTAFAIVATTAPTS